MNHYKPRQRESDMRWDYTARNDDHIWPIGYCRPFTLMDAATLGVPESMAEEENALREKFRDKYHTNGHDNAEDACACYKRYLLDRVNLLHYQRYSDTQYHCKNCLDWTDEFIEVNHVPYNLCARCRTLVVLERLVTVGESISSY